MLCCECLCDRGSESEAEPNDDLADLLARPLLLIQSNSELLFGQDATLDENRT